jgi:ABC-2 type transport system ATP-binding protein
MRVEPFFFPAALSEVQRVADRVGIIRSGKLIALETIASLRGKGIRKIELELASEPQESVFEGITGIRSLLIERNRVFISYEGTMEKLLSAVMGKCDLLDISTNEADLEEFFLTYYHDESV